MALVRSIDLKALAMGALDPARARAVAAEVESSEALRQELTAVIAAQQAEAQPGPGSPWRVPLPSLRAGAMQVRVTATATLASSRPGEVQTVHLSGVPDPERRAVVVLRRDPEQGWTLVFPEDPEDWVAAQALANPEGGLELRFTVSAESGPQRWAAVFPERDAPPDWTLAPGLRWAPLQARLASGEVPVVAWDVPVAR